ncbi:MAG: amidophosphoribosyltransferase [Peptococcaceae bacterium]|jgi:amidophosphoribosyltransferase|nr:amidophosphoribosyltransferase [Peptococcaceae bacterium]
MCDERLNEGGIFAIYARGTDVAKVTYFSLYALQHRGQTGAGIAVAGPDGIRCQKGLGTVGEVFTETDLNQLNGHMAIGHVQRGEGGVPGPEEAQPLVCRFYKGAIALEYNGNLINLSKLREDLFANGSIFHTYTDAELMVNLIARYSRSVTLEEALMKCMVDIKGVYAMTVMSEDKLIGVRDPYGNRPLCIGRIEGNWVLASESCTIGMLGGTFVRDVAPGEIVTIDEQGLHSVMIFPRKKSALCMFEYIYFARPDSVLDGINVMSARKAMGRELAWECPVEADLVIPVPDSGIGSALGYADALGISYNMGLIKNRYMDGSDVKTREMRRDLSVRLKLNPVTRLVEGKRVALVDDSLIKGTTSRMIARVVREKGAREVHFLTACPPVRYPCKYGVGTFRGDELTAAARTVEETRRFIGCDSLYYLSLEGIYRALGSESGFCAACFDGVYPVNGGEA